MLNTALNSSLTVDAKLIINNIDGADSVKIKTDKSNEFINVPLARNESYLTIDLPVSPDNRTLNIVR